MRARVLLFFALLSYVFISNINAQVVTKAACTEYEAAWLYSDGVARAFIFNVATNHVEITGFQIGGRKAVDISTGFNRITILDDQGYVWVNDAGKATATRWNTDATGAAFNGNVSIYGYFYTYVSIRSDGSIWYWGGDDYRFYGGTSINAPVKLPQPAGVKFVKIATGNSLLGLTSTGDVYEWDKGSTKYTKVTLPRPATDIAASQMAVNIAVVPDNIASSTMGYPYAWGSESRYWGGSGATYLLSNTQALKTLWKMPAPIKKITANQNVIHYIDANGDLYGIGDNPNGEIGNGQELVNKTDKYPTPYAWSWIKYEMLTGAPAIHVLPGVKFKDIFAGNSFAFYHYAVDVKDSLYFWGRNKSFVGGDGAVNNNESTYPNALDVATPSMRTPLGVKPTQTAGYNFAFGKLTTPGTQAINGVSATLTVTAKPATLICSGRPNYGYNIVKYQWAKVSGPTSYSITSPNSASTAVTGLVAGTYVFSIQTTDNQTGTITAYQTLVVNTGVVTPGPPGASAGSDQTMTLPTSSATLTGTGLETNGTITAYQWSQVSGPGTATFANAKAAQTAVSGLAAGSYVFKLTVTDGSGLTASDQMTITVNPAVSSGGTFTVDAGPDVLVSLPATIVQLAGVATVSGGEYVATCKWSEVSGPSTASISGGGSITPTISGLVAGIYVFRVALTSKSGKSSSDQMTLTVSTVASGGIFTVSAGPDAYIYSPATSYKIAGVATVKGLVVASCKWAEISGPSAASLHGTGSITPTASSLIPGTYTFEVTITSTSGVVAKDQMNVNVNVTKTSDVGADVSTSESSALLLDSSANISVAKLNIYPNPVYADQQINVDAQNMKAGLVKFMIYDISGRLVKQSVLDNQAPSFKQTISLSGLVRGVYMLAVLTQGESKPKTFKFIIQ